jgi:hypothetical protein
VKVLNRFATATLMLAVAGPTFAQDPGAAPAQGAAATLVDRAAEMSAIRVRLNELEAKQLENARKAAERKTTEQVIEDASKRSEMLEVGNFGAGHQDGRFFIGSDDGKFVLRPFIQLQFREVTVNRQDFKNGGVDDDTQSGFEVRRLRFGFDGNAFTPDLSYFFIWGTTRASGTANVNNAAGTRIGTVSNNLGGALVAEEAWVKYHFADSPFYIKGGNIRDPLSHEQIIGTVRQQAVERSISADVFANGEGYTEGATLIYDPKTWVRTEAGVNHGLRAANTNFLDYPNSNAFNYGAAGRAEFKVFGRWQDYSQIGAVDVKEPLLVVGVGADYSERGHAGQTVGTVDVMYADQNGLSLYGGVMDRYTNHNFGFYQPTITGTNLIAPPATVLNKHTNEYAAFIQAGLLIGKHWEPYGRFEYIHVAGTAAGTDTYIPAVAGGVNYYFYGHRVKLTAQVQYLPKGLPFDDTPNDVLTSLKNKGEISGTVQFQLVL